MKWRRGKITWDADVEFSGLVIGNWILINHGEGYWGLNHVPSTMWVWESPLAKQKQVKLHWERFFEKHPELLNLDTEHLSDFVPYRKEINEPLPEI